MPMRPRKRPTPPGATTEAALDPARQLYQAERDRVDTRRFEEMYWTNAGINAAREELKEAVVAGGPRVRLDGTVRRNHYNSSYERENKPLPDPQLPNQR